jgi:penicillin-binding protein 2
MFSNTDRLPSARIKVALVAAAVVLGALIIGAFRLQVVKYSHYRSLARDNYVVQVSIKAPRGDIEDSKGTLLAGCRQSFSIYAVPRSILRNSREIAILSRILDMEEERIRAKLGPTSRSYKPTAVVRDADFATLSAVEESFADLPDVMVIAEPIRSYPAGSSFSHMVGYVGEVTQDEINASPKDYGSGDFIGKAGIEKEYEVYLRGRDGRRSVKFTPGGGTGPIEVDDPPRESPRPGMKVVLYADAALQELASQLLDGRRGCIMAIDVRTGGILAMVSSPSFDPNLFVVGISSDDWQKIVGSEAKPLVNRNLQCSYPPGSTFKIVSAGMGLEEGVLTAATRFAPCTGSYRFGNRTFSCWKDDGHGALDLTDAIKVSCDVYFYQLGERLSVDMFGRYGAKWRLAQKTGIDLPGEIGGLVPDAAYYDRAYGKGKWTRGVMLNLSIGQGELLLTPLELLCFVCGVANGGTYRVPRCVERAGAAGAVQRFQGDQVALGVSERTLDIIRTSMLRVVEGEQGTGRAARVPGYQVAGKTGTAQNPHGGDHASFVCFAPFNEPQIAIYVLVENAGHGSTEAAPLARRMLFEYFGITESEEVAVR